MNNLTVPPMKYATKFAIAVGLALAASPLVAQDKKSETGSKSAQASKEAQTFVNKAASGGMFEVESSKLAVDKAKRDDVKTFAQKMVTDHGKANADLQSMAQKAGVKVPDKMEPKHQAQLEKLGKTGTESFDKAYVDAQVEAHKEAVGLFQNYAKSGDQPDLKQFAEKTLPTLQEHQRMAQDLARQGAVTGGSSGTSGKSR